MPERTVSILAILKDNLSPGLKNIGKNLRGLKDSVGKLGGQFSFLTGTAAKFIGAFAGIQGIRRALDLAEKQVEATTQLAFALEGLPATYAEINKAADDFQSRTTTGNEEFQKMAALLKEGGVSAEKLAASTEAVFQAAAKLQKPVGTVAEALLVSQQRGVALRGTIGTLVGDLTKTELKAGKAFDILIEGTKGASEALAATPFGRAKQEANELGDTLEEIGMTLIDVKVAFLEAANKGVKMLLKFFQSPTWGVFTKVLGQVVSFAVDLLPTVVKLVVAFKAWRLAVWAVTTAKLALVVVYKALAVVAGIAHAIILAPWLVLPALVVVAVLAVQRFFNIFGALGSAFEGLGETSETLWAGIASGAIGVGDVITVVKNAFLTLLLEIGTGFFDPVESAFRKLWALITGGWNSLSVATDLIFLGMADAIGDSFFDLVTFIAEQVDKITGLAADALALIPTFGDAMAEGVRSNIADATRGGFMALDAQLDAAKAAAVEAVTDTKNALDEIDAEMEKSADTSAKAIALMAAETEAILAKAREGAAGDIPEVSADVSLETVRRQNALMDQIAAVRAGKNQEALDIIAAQEADALQRDFDMKRISEFEFAAERLRIAEETNEREKKLIDDQIAALELLADERWESGQATVDVLQKQLVLEKKQQEGAAEYAKTLRALSDDINKFAANLTTQAVAAQDELNASIEETATLVAGGAVTQEEAAARNVAAMKLFEDEIKRVQTEILALQTQGGDTEAFETAMAKIVATWEEGSAQLGDTTESFGARAKAVWLGISDSFRNSMVQPLMDFTDTMADMFMGFETGFASAGDAFKDFGKQALKTLLQILQKWLIMKALGLPTFGSGANAGGLVHESGMVFAGGGHVPGPAAVHRDTVPAMLTPGEFVVKESASSYYGAGIMRALNQMMFPRALFGRPPGGAARYAGGGFQAGGAVAASASGAPAAGPTEALVVPSEGAFSRLLAGGEGSMLRFFEAHRTEISGILGG